MSLENNKALTRRFLRDIWSEGKLEVADEILAPNFVMNVRALGVKLEGPALFKQLVTRNRTAFQGLKYDPDEERMVAEGDKVVVPWTMSARHVGQWGDATPSNKDVSIKGMSFFQVANDRLVLCEVQNETLSLMRQIGAVPPQGTPEYKVVEANKALARRFFDAAWNRGDFALLEQLTIPNSVDHSTVGGVDHSTIGSESFKQIVAMFRTAIPDVHLTIEDEIAAGDKVVHRWKLQGTHQGILMGVPPTGKLLTFTGTTTVRIASDKIAERWANVDELGLLQQLGVVPPPPASSGE